MLERGAFLPIHTHTHTSYTSRSTETRTILRTTHTPQVCQTVGHKLWNEKTLCAPPPAPPASIKLIMIKTPHLSFPFPLLCTPDSMYSIIHIYMHAVMYGICNYSASFFHIPTTQTRFFFFFARSRSAFYVFLCVAFEKRTLVRFIPYPTWQKWQVTGDRWQNNITYM